MTRIPSYQSNYDQYNKHRNEEEDAIMSFLSEGGKVTRLRDSETSKKLESKVKKDESKGCRFIFSKDERNSNG